VPKCCTVIVSVELPGLVMSIVPKSQSAEPTA
jgi:hypothetical protein